MANGKSRLTNRVICSVVLAVIVAAVAATYRATTELSVSSSIEPRRWVDAEGLSDGDLVFRTGRDLMSRLILAQGNSPQFSHVGVILRRESTVFVVHSLPEGATSVAGVQVEPLSSFVSSENASDVAFYRVKGINDKSRQKMREYVLKQVGKPFDAAFLLSTDDSMYCTELAVKALAAAGIHLVAELPHIRVMLIDELVIPPDYLRRSRRLESMMPNKALQRDAQQTARP
ncbi:MAG: YiiX/YebB-like N1pC/P60 family cysteine hydrolase [Methylococcaceae bacterium]